MRFEAREIKSYAEPILPESLRKGNVYFSITYADEELLIPVMETLVFIGRDLDKGDRGILYFQDAISYTAGERYGDATAGGRINVSRLLEQQTKHIFDFERALEQLMGCSLRRRAGNS